MDDKPSAADLRHADNQAAIKSLRLLLFQLYREVALREPDPLAFLDALGEKMVSRLHGVPATAIGPVSAEYVKHGMLSQTEKFLEVVGRAVEMALEEQYEAHPPREGPTADL